MKASSASAAGSAYRAKKRGSRLFVAEAKASNVRDQPQEAARARAQRRTRGELTLPDRSRDLEGASARVIVDALVDQDPARRVEG